MSPQTLAALGMYEGVASTSINQLDSNDQHGMVKVLLEGAIKRVEKLTPHCILVNSRKNPLK